MNKEEILQVIKSYELISETAEDGGISAWIPDLDFDNLAQEFIDKHNACLAQVLEELLKQAIVIEHPENNYAVVDASMIQSKLIELNQQNDED